MNKLNPESEIVACHKAAAKKRRIDQHDEIQSQIDVRAETLLMNLSDALTTGRDELLSQVEEDKRKVFASLADDSQLCRDRDECQQQLDHIKNDLKTTNAEPNAFSRREEIWQQLNALKKKLLVLDQFLDDLDKRACFFEPTDVSLFGSLIGRLRPINDQ